MAPLFKKTEKTDWFLPKDIQKQLAETFKSLKNPVSLELFTQQDVNEEFSDYTIKFCADLARISDKITVTQHKIPSPRADELGVSASPTLCVAPDDYHIRFLGAPLGEEGKAFITAIMLVSLGMSGLSDVTTQLMDTLNEERMAQVFVSPT